jgi:hypothetical protein
MNGREFAQPNFNTTHHCQQQIMNQPQHNLFLETDAIPAPLQL